MEGSINKTKNPTTICFPMYPTPMVAVKRPGNDDLGLTESIPGRISTIIRVASLV